MVKLTSSVKGGHNQFKGRNPFRRVYIYWDSPPVIFDRYRVVLVYSHPYSLTITCQRFINTVVDNFPNQMMQSFNRGIAYIHRRSFPNSLETVKYFYLVGIIM